MLFSLTNPFYFFNFSPLIILLPLPPPPQPEGPLGQQGRPLGPVTCRGFHRGVKTCLEGKREGKVLEPHMNRDI